MSPLETRHRLELALLVVEQLEAAKRRAEEEAERLRQELARRMSAEEARKEATA